MPAAYSSAQQARQALADRLRDLRIDAKLTGLEHARRCGWSGAKTSRIERNKTTPSDEDIRTWCRTCAADDEADNLVASLRAVEGMFLDWRRLVRDGLHAVQQRRNRIHARAERFRVYSCWLLPGVLQTPAYAERVFRIIQQRDSLVDDVDQAVAARLERRERLTNGKGTYAFVLEEHVLRTGPAHPDVMAAQLEDLLGMAVRPNVSVGIIPAELGRGRWPAESFWIYDGERVNVELVSGSLTVTQPREVATYARAFAELASLAVYGAEARTLITAAIDRL